jgi:hypothetical protein
MSFACPPWTAQRSLDHILGCPHAGVPVTLGITQLGELIADAIKQQEK